MSWDSGKSNLYQFEHLLRGFSLHPADKASNSGSFHDDLGLQPGPESKIPPVPDLMPVVRLE